MTPSQRSGRARGLVSRNLTLLVHRVDVLLTGAKENQFCACIFRNL